MKIENSGEYQKEIENCSKTLSPIITTLIEDIRATPKKLTEEMVQEIIDIYSGKNFTEKKPKNINEN